MTEIEPDTTSGHTAWLQWRHAGIGASDIAAAHTGRYGGAYKAVASRIGIHTGDDIDPELAARGNRWEHAIADGVHAHTGLYVAGEQAMLEHSVHPRWRCTADGLLLPTPEGPVDDVVAGLEIKTRGAHAPWAWDYWLAQCQWSCLVAGLPRWLLAIATIDDIFDESSGALTEQLVGVRYHWVYNDDLFQSELVKLADWLLDHIDRGVLPPPTDADALPYVKAANAEVCPNCDGTGFVEGDLCVLCGGPPDIDDLADLLARYEELRSAAKDAEAERKTAEAVIRARMGDATEAVSSDGLWRVRCGLPVRKFTRQSELDFVDLYGVERPDLLKPGVDRDKVKTEMPDAYDALRIATPDRRLTIKHMEDS